MPYDQFVRLQLAGDELAPDDPDAFIATGFNRCYPDMVDLNDQGLRRQNALNDITETTGLVFLGLTIGCARCHDHKFDPIRQADFYRLQAFFTPARFRDDYPARRAPTSGRARAAPSTAWEGEVAEFQAAIIRLEKPIRDRLAPGPADGCTRRGRRRLQQAGGAARPGRGPARLRAPEPRQADQARRLAATRSARTAQRPATAAGPARATREATPACPARRAGDRRDRPDAPPTYLLRRGEYTARGPEVDPAFPPVLAEPMPRDRRAGRVRTIERPPQGAGRLAASGPTIP